MNLEDEDLEAQLRAALRSEDPGERFTQSVLRRIAAAPPAAARRPSWRLGWIVVAAALVLALGGQWYRVRRAREIQGRAAEQQLARALSLTSASLIRIQNNLPGARGAD